MDITQFRKKSPSRATVTLKRCSKFLKSSKLSNNGCREKYSLSQRPAELHRMSLVSSELVDATEEAIIEYMKCPHCRQYIQPPCMCCEEGHFMCTPCKDMVPACPTCGATTFPNKVNAVFDRILKEMYYPCVNEENGCSGFFKYSEINEHQQQCSYEKVPCRFQSGGCPVMSIRLEKLTHEESCRYGVPCKLFLRANEIVKQSCRWRGSKDQLFAHVCTHPETAWLPPSSLKTNVTFIWMLPMEMNFEKIEFIRLADVGEMFYFHTKSVAEDSQYIGVQHVGNNEIGDTFMYEVTFKNGWKRVIFRDKVIPFTEENVWGHTACCHLHYNFLKYHFQAERVCDCYIRIFQKGQENIKGKRELHFLGSIVSEERDGSVSNRESFQDVIENCLEAMPASESFA